MTKHVFAWQCLIHNYVILFNEKVSVTLWRISEQRSEPMNPIAIRLLSQQLAAPLFVHPAEVVSHMGAMQAQEYRLMRWAVAMRTKRPSIEAFRQAFDDGHIVRLHLLRGTWQLVAAEDYAWMLSLCAPKAIAVINGWMVSNGISIPDSEYAAIRKILEQTAADGESVTKEDFTQALAGRNIRMDDHRLSYHIRMAELSGLLCNGRLQPMKATYSLAAQKVKGVSDIGREEALALLARKYFQSHSPATLEDFVWWSGLNSGDCRKGMNAIAAELYREMWQGREFYIHKSCRTRGLRQGHTLLLPSYDEYLIGYKSRDIALPTEHKHKAHSHNGIFYPVVVCDGVVCGNWKPFADTHGAEFFGASPTDECIAREWKRYRQSINLKLNSNRL